jgi:hypothetical protein
VAGVFGFEPIGITELAIAIGLGFCIIPIVEIVKFIQRAVSRRKELKK